jgi:hypothetical protein
MGAGERTQDGATASDSAHGDLAPDLAELVGHVVGNPPRHPVRPWCPALPPPLVGSLSLQYETQSFLADTDQALCLYTAEAGSPSAEALALLASWIAPSSPAPAIHT